MSREGEAGHGKRAALPRLGDALDGRNNNFDLIRLCAALMVLWGHSYALLKTGDPLSFQYIKPWLGMPVHAMAVGVFFTLSGFLIARSCLRHDLPTYLEARLLRIYPAAILCTVVTVGFLGLAASTLPPAAFFSHPDTWEFLTHNSRLFGLAYGLPGVFEGNPFGTAVNGSLWTLPLELRLYLYLALLGVAGVLRRRWLFNLMYLGLLLSLAVPQWNLLGLDASKAALWLHFFTGTFLYINRQWVPMHILLAAALAGLVALAGGAELKIPGLRWVAVIWLVSYLTLYLGLRAYVAALDVGRLGDFSYGTYLYAFPVQQYVIWKFHPESGLAVFAMALLPTLVLAAISWFLVERRCLGWKGRGVSLARRFMPAFLIKKPQIS